MAHKTTFDDALDYIYIANDRSPNTYIISSALITTKSKDFYNEVKDSITNTTRLTAAAASVTATNNLMGSSNNINSNTINSDSLINGDDMFSGLTVGLGSLLINDTILNNTLFANGSDLITEGGNGTSNVTTTEDLSELIRMAATSVILGLMILITIIGNVFVIAAIILERNLQNVANYLVASLAVADLFVACLVMPLGAVYEISQGWILGPELCDIWTSCDVLCCTASILHLVAIAVDRQIDSLQQIIKSHFNINAINYSVQVKKPHLLRQESIRFGLNVNIINVLYYGQLLMVSTFQVFFNI
uniref:G-protein coupled receptors family 1 profile domain-containing protein n=1 Tax=Glossina brevipalpis TaxID=37001 RepID=A0A1A9W839_9MUSC